MACISSSDKELYLALKSAANVNKLEVLYNELGESITGGHYICIIERLHTLIFSLPTNTVVVVDSSYDFAYNVIRAILEKYQSNTIKLTAACFAKCVSILIYFGDLDTSKLVVDVSIVGFKSSDAVDICKPLLEHLKKTEDGVNASLVVDTLVQNGCVSNYTGAIAILEVWLSTHQHHDIINYWLDRLSELMCPSFGHSMLQYLQSWIGDDAKHRRLEVTQLSNDGVCVHCNKEVEYKLGDTRAKYVASNIKSALVHPNSLTEFEKFEEWLEHRKGKYNIFVDGANKIKREQKIPKPGDKIVQITKKENSGAQIVKVVNFCTLRSIINSLHVAGYAPLVVMPSNYLPEKNNDPIGYKLYEQLIEKEMIYVTPPNDGKDLVDHIFNDDWLWIYGAMSYTCDALSKDGLSTEITKLNKKLVECKFDIPVFIKAWKKAHMKDSVYDVNVLKILPVSSYYRVLQGSNGTWHVPLQRQEGQNEAQWLCLKFPQLASSPANSSCNVSDFDD